MKSRIFMYLFIFTLLAVLFQYTNNKNVYEDQTKRIKDLRAKVADQDSTIIQLVDQKEELQYFSLEHNEEAYSYFDDLQLETDLVTYISDAIYEQNAVAGNNPLVPYESFRDGFKVNKVKVLNHRWMIADFSDGQKWGELLVKYFVNENGSMDVEVVEHLLYP